MGGLFGGGSKKKSSGSSDPKSTTADSIETSDGTVYDRRGTTTAADNATPATSPVATMAAPAQPMGTAAPRSQPMETILPSAGMSNKRSRPMGTLAGQPGPAYG